MVNYHLVVDRLEHIRSSVNRLKKLTTQPKAQFLADPDNFAIAEHHLRRALEAVFDIGRHILAKNGLEKPENYRQVILALGQHKVIPPDFAEKIVGMAGYRNRLTHNYAYITHDEIWSIITTRLNDFAQFYTCIDNYIHKQ